MPRTARTADRLRVALASLSHVRAGPTRSRVLWQAVEMRGRHWPYVDHDTLRCADRRATAGGKEPPPDDTPRPPAGKPTDSKPAHEATRVTLDTIPARAAPVAPFAPDPVQHVTTEAVRRGIGEFGDLVHLGDGGADNANRGRRGASGVPGFQVVGDVGPALPRRPRRPVSLSPKARTLRRRRRPTFLL